MSRMTDTSPNADRVLTEAYRRMSPGEKWLRMGETYCLARKLHAARFRRICPGATHREVLEDYMYLSLGAELVQPLTDAGHLPSGGEKAPLGAS